MKQVSFLVMVIVLLVFIKSRHFYSENVNTFCKSSDQYLLGIT